MSLLPRDSWSDFNRLLDATLPHTNARWSHGQFSPNVDVIEKETAFELIADLPGVDKKDISVTYDKNVLTISAATLQRDEHASEGKYIHKERYEGKMVRSFTLNNNLNANDIYAEFTDGVLVVVVPKIEPDMPQARDINIS
ncbi:heat-shock protein Hsp20 [Vibrio ponticus]|uniref:Heat-shock protein Hsp20 n=1 Tax=Vibrio ponticus TaxID=265668 RepID=A0ABX3FN62_9VIBR|nr:Hsp20/alpha crystallin family protein [Vibrio ponticus]OLQ94629.1 heat-shock protein Hsp20 [Vibrio ponticus]